MVKEAHKELKRKVNLQEEVRRKDRSTTSWQELRDLKKIKLKMKDRLYNEKRKTTGDNN